MANKIDTPETNPFDFARKTEIVVVSYGISEFIGRMIASVLAERKTNKYYLIYTFPSMISGIVTIISANCHHWVLLYVYVACKFF